MSLITGYRTTCLFLCIFKLDGDYYKLSFNIFVRMWLNIKKSFLKLKRNNAHKKFKSFCLQ